jgi:O-antigen/teichoic acid export membrane protein
MNFGVFFFIAKLEDISRFSDIAFGLTVSSLLVMISEFGQRNSLLVKGTDKYKAQLLFEKAKYIFWLNNVFGIIFFLSICLVFTELSILDLLIIYMFNLVLSLCELLFIYCRLTDQAKKEMYASYSNFIFTTIALYAAWKLNLDGIELVFLIVLLRVFVYLWVVYDLALCSLNIDKRYSEIIKEEFSYLFDSLASSSFSSIELIISRGVLTSTQYATFQIAQKFCQASFVLIQALSSVFIPIISREKKLNYIYILTSVLTGILVSIILYFSIDFILQDIFNINEGYKVFSSSLSIYIAVRYFAAAFGSHILAYKLNKERISINIALIVVYISMFFYIVPIEIEDLFYISSVSFLFVSILYVLVVFLNGYFLQNKKNI